MLDLTGARDYDQAALEKLIVPQCERRFPDEPLRRGLLKNCLVSNAARELKNRMRSVGFRLIRLSSPALQTRPA